MSGNTMRGLTQFITDIRLCKNKEQETSRVDKELAKIRGKFTQNKGLSGYHRKKYVWKLLYMYILGHEVDFGQFESANLINSQRFSEKYTGYIATGILVNESDEKTYKTISNAVKHDLCGNNEINSSLALSMMGALAPKELTECMEQDVQRISFSENRTYSLFVRKKAILCLLRMLRKYPSRFQPETWVPHILNMFEGRYLSLGFISSACSLLLGVMNLISQPDIFRDIVPKIVKILQKLVLNKECSQDYMYYHTPNPWLQVKLLKILQFFPFPEDPNVNKALVEVLKKIIKRTEVTKSVNKNNADHGILFEATNLIIGYGSSVPEYLLNDILKLLGIFLNVREPNLKYLGLETMCKFCTNNEHVIEKYLPVILQSLKMNDISIKRRALDLLYLMCTEQSAQQIVKELLAYSEEWADLQIKEELVLKIAILAERYAENLVWYIEVVIKLIVSSGDFVTEDIWYRIIQMITGFGKESNPQLQKHAAVTFFTTLNVPHAHETLIMISAYIISEYAQYLVETGKEPQKIFDVLQRHFQYSSEKVRCMLLNAYAKLASKFPELRDQVSSVFLLCAEHFDPDLQQRGVEYNAILEEGDEVQTVVYAKQPPYTEDIQNNNPLIKRIYKLKLTGAKEQFKDPAVKAMLEKQANESLQIALQKSNVVSKSQDQSANSSLLQQHFKKLSQCELYEPHIKKLCLEGVSIETPVNEKIVTDKDNLVEVKQLLVGQIGVIYQKSDEIVIQYKSEYQEHMGQIAMQFQSQISKLENLSIMIANPDQNNGMDFNISPVNYSGQHPVIILQVMSISYQQSLPKCTLFCEVNGTQKKYEFFLPIYTNKFLSPVDMPLDPFNKFYEEYSSQTESNYYKLDNFMPNPASVQTPISDVLKKFGGLLTSLGLKLQGYPDMNNLQYLNGAGQFIYKDTNKSQQVKLPLIIQIAGDENYKSHIRISLRGGGSGAHLKNIYQLIYLYISP